LLAQKNTALYLRHFIIDTTLVIFMNQKNIRIDYFRGSGPGGQHRNTSETGVRITHLPTGMVVTATESRSRHQNLQKAMLRLEEKLAAKLRKKKRRIATRPGRGAIARRLDSKRKQSEKKRDRQRSDD
jgi:protein subunit release factor A